MIAGGTCLYEDRRQVTQLNLGNGPDWATQRPDVQGFLSGFLNRAIDDGAGGFRFDAAKHIETNGGEDSNQPWAGNFWDTISSGMHNKSDLFLYGEVLPDAGDNDQQYQSYFRITTHGYLWMVISAIDNQNLSSVRDIYQFDHTVSPIHALVYAENHDMVEHGETQNFSYFKRLASYSIMIARAGMTILVFDRPGSDDIWKDPDLVSFNQFRNAVVGEPEYLRFPTNPVMMIERGNRGTVIVNVSGNDFGLNSPTAIATGTYTNKGTRPASFSVSGGNITGTVPANSVITLYNGGTTVPTAPTNLSASAVSSDQINLSWSAATGAASYTIYKSTSSSNGFTGAGATAATSFEMTGLSADTTYYFNVTATNSAGTSPN